ncbi:branched-chain alpha-ketoacid dehydrogenase kinase [Lipomyces chichibuensis]|uniref:branched-chain alpha-ketoacid dehydrogenase kinase n=1 Tax=Lipomyces chichibuensis TaxID=1546026 RepID=UPI003342EC7F
MRIRRRISLYVDYAVRSSSIRRIFTCSRQLSKFSLEEPVYTNFDVNEVIGLYARAVTTKISSFNFQDLIQFGRPPIPDEALIQNARTIREIILTSLSRRTLALRNLPYIMVLNPNISQIYNIYLHSINIVYKSGVKLETKEDNDRFVEALQNLVDTHTNAVPTLAKGFAESQTYISNDVANRFLDAHLHDRIGTRLMSKHHIALTKQSAPNQRPDPRFIGLVDTQLSPMELCREITLFLSDVCDLQYGMRPTMTIDVGEDVKFAYIPEHLEYILTELLKNSFRATIEQFLGMTPASQYRITHNLQEESAVLYPVVVTIVKTPGGVEIRLRDRGGGIEEDNLKRIWGYSESTFEEEERDGFKTLNTPPPSVTGTGGSSIGGLGYGLPLSQAYAEYFGGSIDLETCFGWGTDVYLTINSPQTI